MVIPSTLLTLALACVATTLVQGSPLLRNRDSIGHTSVVALPQTVPNDTSGDLYLAYQPKLKVVNGCVPFPAVDVAGSTNAGLKDTGNTNGGCKSSIGQTYVRSAIYGGYFAIMYSWYFPKDQSFDGISLGHRHDWEGAIVWLNCSTALNDSTVINVSTANNGSSAIDCTVTKKESSIVAVCPSAHGGWDCSTNEFKLDGISPLIKYESKPPLNHAMGLTDKVGEGQPLVAWESMPPASSQALATTDFGDANVPFIDQHFEMNLGKAKF